MYDILYLDVPQFESLASQQMEGIEEFKTIYEEAGKEEKKTDTKKEKSIDNSAVSVVGQVKAIRLLDHIFSKFIKSIESEGVRLASEMTTARAQCEEAMEKGHIVVGSGPFFYEDVNWLRSSMKTAMAFDELPIINLEKVKHLIPNGKEETALKKQLIENHTFQQKQYEHQKKYLEAIVSATEQLLANSVTCGVVLGDPRDEALFLNASLDRNYLRPNARLFNEHYGTRTRAKFTLIGTVSGIGWHEELYLSAEERAVARGQSVESPRQDDEPAERERALEQAPDAPLENDLAKTEEQFEKAQKQEMENARNLRLAIWNSQGFASRWKRKIFLSGAGGGDKLVSIFPIAIYRELQIGPKKK